MTKEAAIAITLPISRIGQQVYFQIPIPRDANRIIGFEWGAFHLVGLRTVGLLGPQSNYYFDVRASKVIGRITLWAASPENIFLQDQLIENRNIQIGENITGDVIDPQDYMHGRKREQVSVNIEDHPAFIEGFYQDSWGIGESSSLQYLLHLYLWIEKCPL
ncbi:MAG TPA: hypothetical protein VF939_08950 [Puia sp.]